MSQDRTLVQIRERSFVDLLDLALVVVRHRPLALGAAAAVGIAPWAALDAFLMSRPEVATGWWLPLLAIQSPWATAPLTITLGGMMFGERPSPGKVLATLLRAAPSLFFYQGLLRGFLLMTVAFSPILPAKLAFLNEVILLERGKLRSILGRTSRLCADGAAELFGQWAVLIVFGAFFVTAFRWAAEIITNVLLGGEGDGSTTGENAFATFGAWLFDWRDWRAQVALWIVVAFWALTRFLTYIDRRIRLEGWEVELRLRLVGAAMEDAERW